MAGEGIPKTAHDEVGENPWENSDIIGFIDTNSEELNGKRLFVSSPSFFLWEGPERRFCNVHYVTPLVGCCEVNLNPERIGWADFIQRLTNSDILSGNGRVLVVVDSDKNDLTQINGRTQEVFDGFYLPENFVLAYATSDGGVENWINKEMRRRDKVSGRAMKKVKEDDRLLMLLPYGLRIHIENVFEDILIESGQQ